jgi:ABC-type amino acid transport system permease subunit
MFDWEFAWEILPLLGRAAVVTVEATLLGFALAAVLGMAWALLRRSRGLARHRLRGIRAQHAAARAAVLPLLRRA